MEITEEYLLKQIIKYVNNPNARRFFFALHEHFNNNEKITMQEFQEMLIITNASRAWQILNSFSVLKLVTKEDDKELGVNVYKRHNKQYWDRVVKAVSDLPVPGDKLKGI